MNKRKSLSSKTLLLLFENKLQVIVLLIESYYQVFEVFHHIYVNHYYIDLFHEEFHYFESQDFSIHYSKDLSKGETNDFSPYRFRF